jgi:hypothetical protein
MRNRIPILLVIFAMFGLVLANCGGGVTIPDSAESTLAVLDDLEITEDLNVEGDFEDEGLAVSDVREIDAIDFGFANVGGHVVTPNPDDEGHLPLEGALVTLTRIYRHKHHDEPLVTTTDDEGKYFFERVPAGYYHISARKHGYTIKWSILLVSGRHPLLIKNFVLHPIPDDLPTASLAGRVMGLVLPENDGDDFEWLPVEGATVTMRHARFAIEPIEVATGPEGGFTVDSMVAGPWHAVIEAEGFKPAYRKIHVRPEVDNFLGVRLFPENTPSGIFGLVLTPRQQSDEDRPELVPVPGATLTLTPFHGGDSLTTASGEDGHYSFFGIRAGIYRLVVEKEGFRTRRTLARVGINPHRLNVVIYGEGPPTDL